MFSTIIGLRIYHVYIWVLHKLTSVDVDFYNVATENFVYINSCTNKFTKFSYYSYYLTMIMFSFVFCFSF